MSIDDARPPRFAGAASPRAMPLSHDVDYTADAARFMLRFCHAHAARNAERCKMLFMRAQRARR